ncbi:uncharacterized protein AB675_2415 [Cyphellophora attinorum]|uniref:Uncharacterized protein n=1 Tax=Cyphellophora attinorum TaxID=1664694 RepID=A0A0N1HGD8_9EURO|nr:uncharacterized protein AB675_2415 [Phialophora attinorum]KPI45220.1 hypothetical protein AB675_2415 [Phialophora attinorum]
MAKNNRAAITEREYEQLPPALQRKYFSSLERLRLAHDGSVSPQSLPKHRRHSRTRSTFAKTKSLFETFDGIPSIPYIHPSLRPATSHRRTIHTADTLVNSDTAAWFASLPLTVQRKHFTKEEQVLFANENHHIILDAADELLQRQRLPPDSDLLWLPHPETSQTPEEYSPRSSFDIEHGDSRSMSSQQYLDSLSRLDNDSELDLRLDDYHAAIAQTAQRQQAAPLPLKHSYRRNMSLSTVSLRRTSISTPPRSASRVPSLYFNRLQTPTTPQRPSFHHGPTSSVSTVDPRATHYQDPAARMKLRVYLASPSKFDEAIEFGFPSMADKQSRTSDRPKTSPRAPTDSARMFANDDVPSLVGDDGSSHSEVDALSDPRTPNESEFRGVRSKKSSVDRASLKPQVVRSDQYAQSTALDREMTIHMTLTRPDLRSPTAETRPSSRHINSQPLEQAPLMPANNGQNFWDTLPAPSESRVKKLWRKFF